MRSWDRENDRVNVLVSCDTMIIQKVRPYSSTYYYGWTHDGYFLCNHSGHTMHVTIGLFHMVSETPATRDPMTDTKDPKFTAVLCSFSFFCSTQTYRPTMTKFGLLHVVSQYISVTHLLYWLNKQQLELSDSAIVEVILVCVRGARARFSSSSIVLFYTRSYLPFLKR